MYTDRMIALIKASNKLRFDMDKVTIGIDLSKRDNIAKVYQKLEEGVKLFEDFYAVQQDMEKSWMPPAINTRQKMRLLVPCISRW